jgi:hypothetical protein
MLTTMALAPGDIVILGSDGLWDNVSEEELLQEVEKDVLEGEELGPVLQFGPGVGVLAVDIVWQSLRSILSCWRGAQGWVYKDGVGRWVSGSGCSWVWVCLLVMRLLLRCWAAVVVRGAV